MNPDGSGAKQILNSASATMPAWSPGGYQIVFYNGGIETMNADGSSVRALTSNISHQYPNWSMSGSNQIIFNDANGDPGDYYHSTIDVVNSDGTGLTRLTFDARENITPAWSPDGKKIAFGSAPPGYQLFVMNADGSGEQQLTPDGGEYPDWSPDGSKILFSHAVTPGCMVIAVVNADGSGETNLTSCPLGGIVDTHPTWWGTQKVVFASNRDQSVPMNGGPYKIYTMDITGANQTRISNTSLLDANLSCSRCPRFDK